MSIVRQRTAPSLIVVLPTFDMNEIGKLDNKASVGKNHNDIGMSQLPNGINFNHGF